MAAATARTWSPEEARAHGRKGGLASGVARREKKTLRQCLEALLAAPSDEVEGLSNREALAVALFKKAYEGDVRAAAVIRDTVGEKPVDAVKLDLSARFAEMSLEEKETEARRMAAELGLS